MAAGYDDPALQRRRLRVELRKARLDAGKTQRDVAEAMDWSVSKVIRIENGDVGISRNDLKALLEHYEMTDDRRVDTLLEVARVARGQSWSDFRDVFSPAFLTYLAFESSVWVFRNYECSLLPGLLQTEEYAWTIQLEVFGESPQTAERRWDAKEQRQKLHQRDKPPKMSFIIDEAAIRRSVGGPSVMRRQLQRLKGWGAEPHVSLQVLPFGLGAYPGMGVPFVLLEFHDPTLDNLLYVEQATELTTRDDPKEAGQYADRYSHLERLALSPAETDALLDRVMDEIATTATDPGNPAKSSKD